MKQNIIDRINHLANEKEPFLFVINYAGSEAYIQKLSEIAIDECLYDFEGITLSLIHISEPTRRS